MNAREQLEIAYMAKLKMSKDEKRTLEHEINIGVTLLMKEPKNRRFASCYDYLVSERERLQTNKRS